MQNPVGRTILALLEGLRTHGAGHLVYEQIRLLLNELIGEQHAREEAYGALVGVLLDTLAEQLPGNDPARLQIRLVQCRLRPPLHHSELKALQHYVPRWSARLHQLSDTHSQLFRHVLLDPLLRGLGFGEAERGSSLPPQVPATATKLSLEAGQGVEVDASETGVQEDVVLVAESGENAAYRQHLDETSRGVRELQTAVTEQIEDTIKQHQEFGVLLEVVLAGLRDLDEVDDVGEQRRLIAQEAERLLTGHRALTAKLGYANQSLKKLSEDSHKISDELSRVRELSLTDELTGLPNRRAFQRSLEDEIGRGNRYGYPVTLAIIDLDKFKQVNDTYGHPVGDRVLIAYAKEILPIFRHHDRVARYGGEEFAVLLPNTDLVGSLRALEKILGKVPSIAVRAAGEMIKVPTFSAGVALYHSGETAEALVARADAALYQAKRNGRNRIDVAHEDQSEAVLDGSFLSPEREITPDCERA